MVYLNRPADSINNGALPMYEPVFSPKVVTADIGEQIHFVAQFADQRAFAVGIPSWKFPDK